MDFSERRCDFCNFFLPILKINSQLLLGLLWLQAAKPRCKQTLGSAKWAIFEILDFSKTWFEILLLCIVCSTFTCYFYTAWIASISFGLTFVLSPLSCFLCKRFGCKAVTVLGGILVGIGLLLSSFVDNIFRMYVTYSFLFGMGSSMCYVSSVLVLSGYFSKNLVVANGIGLAGAGVGTITLAPALSLLLDNFYWRDALRILSATSLLILISGLIFYLVPAPLEFSDAEKYDTEEETKRIDLSFFKNKAYIVWTVVVGLVLFGFYIPYVHLVSET